MSKEKFDCIVVGAGLVGASVAVSLLQAGKKILLLDAHEPHHDQGSSHGYTRISRIGDEHPYYPAWTAESRTKMEQMESQKGEIIKSYPSVNIVKKDSAAYVKINESASKSGFPCTEVSAAQLVEQGFKGVSDGYVGLVDAQAATMDPHILQSKLYDNIVKLGGKIKFSTEVKQWYSFGKTANVKTDEGVFEADNLVFATNAWTPEILARASDHIGSANKETAKQLADQFYTLRVPLYFFKWPEQLQDTIVRVPYDNGHGNMYAMKELDPSGETYLKVGFHAGEDKVRNPSEVERKAFEAEIAQAKEFLAKIIGTEPEFVKAKTCLYGMTENKSEEVATPIIGEFPGLNNVHIAAGFCGNGAKFCLEVGDIVTRSITEQQQSRDLTNFSCHSRM